MSAREFSLGLGKWADDNEERADQLTRAIGLEALKGIVETTPVDTGRARGNWQVNQTGDAPELDVEDKTGADTVAKGSTEIAKQDRTKVFFIANGLPYIIPLEFGHSAQNRAMVRQTLNRLRAFVGAL